MIFKLSIALLLFLLAGIWLFIGYCMKTSLLLGLGFGVIFGVTIMLLPDVLEWIIKRTYQKPCFILKQGGENLLVLSSYFTYIGFVCCHIVCAPFTMCTLNCVKPLTLTFPSIVNPSPASNVPATALPAMTVYHKTEGYLL